MDAPPPKPELKAEITSSKGKPPINPPKKALIVSATTTLIRIKLRINIASTAITTGFIYLLSNVNNSIKGSI